MDAVSKSMQSDERAYMYNSNKTDSKYCEHQMKAEIVGAICNEWQDAKKEQDGNGL
jgi:hypothetical protein